MAAFPARDGLTPKVTLDFAFATRVAGLIAATVLGTCRGRRPARRGFTRIKAVVLLPVVCRHHH